MTPHPAENSPRPRRFPSRTAWLLVAGVAVWMAGLTYPLLESTEGRYASIAAEMVWTGNWLDPAFNGVPHFSKPPLAYWAGALGIAALGRSEFAVRLPATLALAVCAALVFVLARRLGLGRRESAAAAVMAGLSPLSVAQGRMTSSDIFLWIGVLAFYLGLLAPGAERERTRRGALLTGFGLGWGFLAKGPVVLLWTLLPLVFLGLSRVVRRIAGGNARGGETISPGSATWRFSRLRSPFALAPALVLGLPWYGIEAVRHPGLVPYWLGSETADRFLTTTHGRSEPFWYFAALLPGIVLPWIPEAARGVRRAWRASGPWAPVLLWVLVPVVFLSLSGSKRPNYLLPAVAPLALAGGLGLRACISRGTRLRLGIWTALVLLSPVALDLGVAPPTRGLAGILRDRGCPVVLYRTLPSSLPFYLGRSVPEVATGHAPPFAGGSRAPSEEILRTAVSERAVFLLRERDLDRLASDLEQADPTGHGSVTVFARKHDLVLVAASGTTN